MIVHGLVDDSFLNVGKTSMPLSQTGYQPLVTNPLQFGQESKIRGDLRVAFKKASSSLAINIIERAVILSRGPNLRAPLGEIRPDALEPAGDSTLEQVEREHIIRVLRATGGVVTKAATRLGMPRINLNALM